MSEAKKPVGLRLTNKLWVVLKQHGIEHHPSDKGQDGFDVTQTIESLLCQALGISLETSTPLSNAVSDERLTEMISQQLIELLSPTLYRDMSDNQTNVSKLLNSKITEIVEAKIGEVTTQLETGTNAKLASLEAEVVELKKPLAIAS